MISTKQKPADTNQNVLQRKKPQTRQKLSKTTVMLAQLQALDDALASYYQQHKNKNKNDALYSDVNTIKNKMDDFRAGDHIIRFSQTAMITRTRCIVTALSKAFTHKVTTFERKVSFLLSFKGFDDFPDVENNKDTVQTQGDDKNSSSITPT